DPPWSAESSEISGSTLSVRSSEQPSAWASNGYSKAHRPSREARLRKAANAERRRDLPAAAFVMVSAQALWACNLRSWRYGDALASGPSNQDQVAAKACSARPAGR